MKHPENWISALVLVSLTGFECWHEGIAKGLLITFGICLVVVALLAGAALIGKIDR